LKKGRVIKSTGSWYTVDVDGQLIECRIKGKFRIKGIKSTNPVSVGDFVEIEIQEDETGVIYKIEDRRNYIIRKSTNLSKQSHIIASNIDQAVLIVTLKAPVTFPAFIDRFLVTAEAYSIPAIVVFNKVDLYGEKEMDDLAFYKQVYEDIGYKCLVTSFEKKIGIEKFKEQLTDKVSLLSGHSGVGKSSLINLIEPDLHLRTKRVSTSHQQGMHTTTFAEMFPLSFGGYIIDTPGIRGFGVYDLDKNQIGHYFPEIRDRFRDCKFNNCVHVNEPGCVVKEAVENGEIASFRYRNYLSMYNEDETETYRQDIYK